jgi:hypothetical protein
MLSCKEDRPEGILGQEQMVKAFRDIYLTEAKVSRLGIRFDSTKLVFELMRSQSFQEMGINDTVFMQSFDWYSQHPNELDQIYGAVIDSLNLMEQRLSLPVE